MRLPGQVQHRVRFGLLLLEALTLSSPSPIVTGQCYRSLGRPDVDQLLVRLAVSLPQAEYRNGKLTAVVGVIDYAIRGIK